MPTLIFILIGLFSFIAGTAVLGLWLRKNPSKPNAEKSSRVMHFLFFAALVAPSAVGLFYPGYPRLDDLLGIGHLPLRPFFLILGIILAIPGFYFMASSNKLLRSMGSGANAFRLTKTVVLTDLYQRTRNPMSLGFYLLSAATGFITGSTFATLGALVAVIPAHIFFLKYFEELELELRFGKPYLEYQKLVPFLFPTKRPLK